MKKNEEKEELNIKKEEGRKKKMNRRNENKPHVVK